MGLYAALGNCPLCGPFISRTLFYLDTPLPTAHPDPFTSSHPPQPTSKPPCKHRPQPPLDIPSPSLVFSPPPPPRVCPARALSATFVLTIPALTQDFTGTMPAVQPQPHITCRTPLYIQDHPCLCTRYPPPIVYPEPLVLSNLPRPCPTPSCLYSGPSYPDSPLHPPPPLLISKPLANADPSPSHPDSPLFTISKKKWVCVLKCL